MKEQYKGSSLCVLNKSYSRSIPSLRLQLHFDNWAKVFVKELHQKDYDYLGG